MYDKTDIVLMTIVSVLACSLTYVVGKALIFILDVSSQNRTELLNNMHIAVVFIAIFVFGLLFFGIGRLIRSEPEDKQ